MTNCLSFDVEGFIESNVQSFAIPSRYIDRAREIREIETNTQCIMELLSGSGSKATFFVLEGVFRDLPHIATEIVKNGHEIALHGPDHVRIYGLTKDEFDKKVIRAKNDLEELTSSKVSGFRAPDFSITENSLWAIDVLRNAGFAYDSSIYPIGMHDVYGIRDAQPFIYKHPNGLVEFPPASTECFGRRIPFGGGGYFRLYPLLLTKFFIKKINKAGHPCMLYLHPYEVGPVIPHIPGIPAMRRFRHYYNCKNGYRRLRNLLEHNTFSTAIDILTAMNSTEGNNVGLK